MKQAAISAIFSTYLLLIVWTAAAPSLSAQEPQPTATPDAQGIIYLQVQPGDTLSAIAFRAGITLEELRALNGLTDTDFIQAGQLLVIGIVTPTATSTPDTPPTPTITRPAPTPSVTPPPPPRTAICLLAFADQNSNGNFESGERLQTAVAFTIYTDEVVIANYVTDGMQEPYCLESLPAGQYQITRSIGRDETLTTSGNRGVQIAVGDVVMLEFGSYRGAPPTITPLPDEEAAAEQPAGGDIAPAAEVEETNAPPSAISSIWVVAGIILFLLLAGGLIWLRRQ